jgi:hypothetical protein
MPEIPRAKRGNAQRPRQTFASESSVRQVSNAVAGFGQQVSNVASQAIKKKADADNAAYLTEQSNKVMREETERMLDIETRGADVDLKENEERWNDRVNLAMENAPSQEAQTALREQLGRAYNSKFLPGYTRHQSKLNVKKRVNSVESALDDIQSEVLTGRTGVAEALARSEAAIVGLAETSGGAVDIDRLRESNNNQIVISTLSGRIDKGQGGSVINEINSGAWDSLTTTSTLSKILRAAKSDVKQRAGAARAEFSKGLGDYMAFVADGKEDATLSAKFSDENLSYAFGDKSQKVIEALGDARDFGLIKNEIATASPDEIRAIVDNNQPTTPENYVREKKQFIAFNAAINNRNKQIAADPALYSIQNSPVAEKAFQEFSQAMESGDPSAMKEAATRHATIQRSVQEDLGVPSESVLFLPKQMETLITKQINDFSQGAEAAAVQLETIKDSFGDEYGSVQRQLINTGNMSPSFSVVSGMGFGQDQINVMEATSIKQSDYKESIGDNDYKSIKQDVAGKMSDFQNTLRGQPGDVRVYNEHKAAIESTAMKYVHDFKLGTSDAINKAMDDVLNNRFSFVDTYRVPIEFDSDQISTSVDLFADEIKSGEIDLIIPFSSQVLNDEDRKAVHLTKIALTPITEPNGTGIMFVDRKNKTILGANNKPVIRTWKELEAVGMNVGLEFDRLLEEKGIPGPLSDLGLQP